MVKTIWALMDDRRGSVGQAKGILNALDSAKFNIIEKNIKYTRFAGLPNLLRGRSLLGVARESRQQIIAPYPDIVLSISRRTAPIARYIKKKSPQTKLVQLMHTGSAGINEFDLIVVPEHDKNKKQTPQMHYIIGCPHRITAEFLQEARAKWKAEFSALPKPLTAVIVGGAIKKRPFSAENALALATAVKKLKSQIGGSILLTTSRRTGEQAQKIIVDALKNIPQYNYLWGDTRENPYSGFLACADNIIVTGDSVSMCCEATGSGKPIYVFRGQKWLYPKHERFVQSLLENGCAALIEEADANFKPQKSLNAAAEIAELIEKL
jgi:hypothetical protein